jgi:hypothetical protein
MLALGKARYVGAGADRPFGELLIGCRPAPAGRRAAALRRAGGARAEVLDERVVAGEEEAHAAGVLPADAERRTAVGAEDPEKLVLIPFGYP